jgi:hypothetical protein
MIGNISIYLNPKIAQKGLILHFRAYQEKRIQKAAGIVPGSRSGQKKSPGKPGQLFILFSLLHPQALTAEMQKSLIISLFKPPLF